jgi:hypothetical protein
VTRRRAPRDDAPATAEELEAQLRTHLESPAERAARDEAWGEAWVAEKLEILRRFVDASPCSRRAADARRAFFRFLAARDAARRGDAWGSLLYAVAGSWAFKAADSPARAGGERGARALHGHAKAAEWALWQAEADRLARERGATWPEIQARVARKFRITARTVRARVRNPIA